MNDTTEAIRAEAKLEVYRTLAVIAVNSNYDLDTILDHIRSKLAKDCVCRHDGSTYEGDVCGACNRNDCKQCERV
mgnify:FL=1